MSSGRSRSSGRVVRRGMILGGLVLLCATAPATAAGSLKSSALAGVSCSAHDACTAVGSSSILPGHHETPDSVSTLAERWNGTSWAVERTPSPAFSSLAGVSCSSPQACTAVGGYRPRSGQNAILAERWNGERWIIQRTPNPPGGESFFNGVSCASPLACVAVGSYMRLGDTLPLVERWNGSRWTLQSTPALAALQSASTLVPPRLVAFSAVSCSSPNACTAVGYYSTKAGPPATLAERWNGKRWALQTTPGLGELDAVSCSSAVACTAVGYLGASVKPLAEHWNGARWALQPTASGAKATVGTLVGVSCNSSVACTAVGVTSGEGARAERWNGNRWVVQRTPNPAVALNAVSCSSGNACTAVGSYPVTVDTTRPLAERWNGRGWTVQRTRT